MRKLVAVSLVGLASCKREPPELGFAPCNSLSKPIGETPWREISVDLFDHSEVQACAQEYELDMIYKEQPLEKQLDRIAHVLQSAGYKELTPGEGPHEVVSTGATVPARRFARGTEPVDLVSVTWLEFPNNKGKPFSVEVRSWSSSKKWPPETSSHH